MSCLLSVVYCIDLERLERSYEIGDEEDELESEAQVLYKQHEKRNVGATMFYVTMTEKNLDENEIGQFADYVTSLAATGGVECSVYNIKKGRILVTLQKGWQGDDLYEMLLGLPQVEHVEWKDRKNQDEKEL